jgi:hypothetical protein
LFFALVNAVVVIDPNNEAFDDIISKGNNGLLSSDREKQRALSLASSIEKLY